MSSASRPDVLQQVDRLWSMLDDLCLNDPAAYTRFIEKQMKDGDEFRSAPELHACLRTHVLEPERGLFYINICGWKRVPAPQDPSESTPLCGGRVETDKDEGQGPYTVLDVAFNPGVLKECRHDGEEMKQVCTLALSFARQQHGFRLSHLYTVISRSPNSSADDLHCRLGLWQPPSSTKQPQAAQTPAALLQQISCLRTEEPDQHPAAGVTVRPAEIEQKKNLIQVLSSTSVQPQTPEHRLEVKRDAAGVAHSLELTVDLPKVCSMSECQLRISKDDVLLEVEDVYYLLLQFPKIVNEDSASATFNKTTKSLTMKVSVL
ncbi:PIH1 domain-containing protein 2 [Genypterus blacodes]|uniref:PIH1 domain-containing protein 2 n=1 Tax=Genypterus blacodes TaxID=154954 RepID=UPI003F75BF93